MNNIKEVSTDERKKEFTRFIQSHVKEAPDKYIKELEEGFSKAHIKGYDSLYDITDPTIFEHKNIKKALDKCEAFTRASNDVNPALDGLNWYIRFLRESCDSYYDFMKCFGIEPNDLFEWGMKSIIFPPDEKVKNEWDNLKDRIFNNGKVYIRGYGRDAHGTQSYIKFYEYLFNNSNVKKDSSNNLKPTAILKRMTGHARSKDIYNYQVSHIWGKTKNIFLFEAPWNICYTPKIIDPFTGHETTGNLPEEFQHYFFEYAKNKYSKYIKDYNDIISSLEIDKKLDEFCKEKGKDNSRFRNDALNELSKILMV